MGLETLNSMYNEQNDQLDIKAIAKLKNKLIHVDREYFILLTPVGILRLFGESRL